MKICINCKKEFEPKGAKAKYCSDLCRVTANRNKQKDAIVTEVAASGSATEKGFTEGLSEYESVMKLYDTFSAQELALAGVRPPKWKKMFKTHGEAIMSCRNVLKKEFGIEYEIKEEDYSKWK